jgi:general stress protein YciG
MTEQSTRGRQGFASMDDERQREIASKGGKSVPDQERSFSKDHGLATEAGRKGGQH